MTRIPAALFNIQGGCLSPDGGYNSRRLRRATADIDAAPATTDSAQIRDWIGRTASHGLRLIMVTHASPAFWAKAWPTPAQPQPEPWERHR